MKPASLESVRSALLEAGLDLFRVDTDAVHLAERFRSHLMDAGVRVRCSRQLGVDVTVRSQRSDFPSDTAERLFARVRDADARKVIVALVEVMARRSDGAA